MIKAEEFTDNIWVYIAHKTRVAENPYMDDSKNMDNFYVTLSRQQKVMSLYFSQGRAIKEPPTLESILECLVNEAITVESSDDLQDWAEQLGYDPDDKKTKRTYNIIKKHIKELKNLLGDENYQTLLYDVEF